MTGSYFIDGVGDEVILVLGIFLAVIVVIVSWMSTRVSDSGARQYDINVTANATAADIIRARPSQQPAVVSDAQNNIHQPQSASAQPSSENDISGASSASTSDTSSETISGQGASSNDPVLRQRHHIGNASQHSNSSPTSEPSPGPSTSSANTNTVTIRLKFMDETMKTVRVSPDDTLDHFRRQNFPPETANRYRLIHQGQVLRNGTHTLRQLRVINDTNQEDPVVPVIHCFLSAAPVTEGTNLPNSATRQLEMAAEELHIGSLLLPLLGLALVCLWYLCIFHTSLFTVQSVVSIVGFTFLYIALVVNQIL